MIAIINTNDLINHMMDAERENIKYLKKELKHSPELIPKVVENVKTHFQAGIEQIKKCEKDEDVVNLIKLAFVNFTVLQLDMKSVQGILEHNGIDLQDLIKASQEKIPQS